jgi:hypothetical protein
MAILFVFENFNGSILAIPLNQFTQINFDLLLIAFLSSFFSLFLIGALSRPYGYNRKAEVLLSFAVSALFILFVLGFGFIRSNEWLFVLQTIPIQITVEMAINWNLTIVGLLFGFLLAGSALGKKDKSISPTIPAYS